MRMLWTIINTQLIALFVYMHGQFIRNLRFLYMNKPLRVIHSPLTTLLAQEVLSNPPASMKEQCKSNALIDFIKF